MPFLNFSFSNLTFELEYINLFFGSFSSMSMHGKAHAFLPCRAMGLNVVYVGDLNYRVSDLIKINPDKSELKKQFLQCIEKF